MSGSTVGGLLGAAIGFFVGGPAGAQAGFALGSLVGGVLGPRPKGAGPGDLKTPGITLGSPYGRAYGNPRLTVNWHWTDPSFTATEQDAGGKGGPSGGGGFTYSINAAGVVCHNTNVLAFPRVWVNGILADTQRAESSAASLAQGETSDYWSARELLDGNPAQVPWAPYENVVTTARASAWRGVTTAGFSDLQCGSSKTLPVVEVEAVTNGTQGTSGALTLLQSRFLGANPNDESAYAWGAPTTSATGVVVSNGYVTITDPDSDPHRIRYTPSGLHPNGTDPITFEAIIRLDGAPAQPGMVLSITGGSPETHSFSWPSIGPPTYLAYNDTAGLGNEGETSGTVGVGEDAHVAIVFTSTQLRVYAGPAGGASELIYSVSGSYLVPASRSFQVVFGDDGGFDVSDGLVVSGFRIRQEEVYTGSTFTCPTEIPAPDASIETWTLLPVTLASIIQAELTLNPSWDPAWADTSDVEDILVDAYYASGDAATVIAELCDLHYVDIVPGPVFKFLKKGRAVVATIPNAHTGMGVEQPGELFAGLKVANDEEKPAVVGLAYVNTAQDHEPGFERGDRLTTESPDIRRIETRLGMEPAQAKGRAITATLMDRVRRNTGQAAVNDTYAALESGDSVNILDHLGNQVRVRFPRLSYADGVKSLELEMEDTTALVQQGFTDETYTNSFELAERVDSVLVPLDIPILRPEHDDPGDYTAVESSGTAFPGSEIRSSVDNVSFGPVIATHSSQSVIGVVVTPFGPVRRARWDMQASIAVDVGSNQTLTSSTRAAMQADREINVGVVVGSGRRVVFRFITATLISPGVYTLTGIMIMRDTDADVDAIVAGDTFVKADASLRRITGTITEIGLTRYLKAVTLGRPAASAAGQAFVNTGVGLTPFAPGRLTVTRDASNNVTFVVSRRDRSFPRYGGPGGGYIPMSEDDERYSIDVYADDTFAAVVRTLNSDIGGHEIAYTAAQQTADGFTPGDRLPVRAYQLSAAVGRGHHLEKEAA